MKTEYHLVLIGTLDLFREWRDDVCSRLEGDFTYKKRRNQLEIIEDGVKTIYIPFTTRMDRENLLGCRFKSIINEIGLTEKELAIFNLFVGG